MSKLPYYLIVLFVTLFTFVACRKMNSNYKDFIVPGGITYVAKASSPMAFVGRNRVKISWLRGSDPNVTKAAIFWNNFTDSVEMDIPSTGDTISYIISNLPEKSYSFMIRTYDVKGNQSILVEVLTAVYGDIYQDGLLNRPVDKSIKNAAGVISINWGSANISGGAFATEVKYTDTAGKSRLLRFPVSDGIDSITDIESGTTFLHRTVFIPDPLSIDTFYTPFEKIDQYLIDKSTWSVIDFSTQHPGGENLASNAIDGTPATRWHTNASSSTYPHYITVDMNAHVSITAFEIWRRTGDDRACDQFQLFVSADATTWTDLGLFDFNRLTDDGQVYPISSIPKARYFKFVGIKGPQRYMVTGEISVFGL